MNAEPAAVAVDPPDADAVAADTDAPVAEDALDAEVEPVAALMDAPPAVAEPEPDAAPGEAVTVFPPPDATAGAAVLYG